jgi:hypothetical protein
MWAWLDHVKAHPRCKLEMVESDETTDPPPSSPIGRLLMAYEIANGLF